MVLCIKDRVDNHSQQILGILITIQTFLKNDINYKCCVQNKNKNEKIQLKTN